MKANIKAFVLSVGILLAIGCGESQSKKNYETASTTDSTKTVMSDEDQYKSKENGNFKSLSAQQENTQGNASISPASGSSSAAVENLKDTIHKFIRTVDIKFKVENVEKATYKIEDIVASHGGFVTYTNLASNVNNASKTQISADSSAETTTFTVTNSITLRVPNTQLDTTLKDMAKLIGFLDYRVIKADDISLQLMANNLLQKRTAQHVQRLAHDIDANPKKLTESANAEDNLLAKQEAADNATISNASLAEQRQYSTIKLELYQPETIATTIVAIPKPLPAYQPSFAARLLHSIQFGWNMVETIFLAILNFWLFILLGLVALLWYRKYKIFS